MDLFEIQRNYVEHKKEFRFQVYKQAIYFRLRKTCTSMF
jgi:hypothetical protein